MPVHRKKSDSPLGHPTAQNTLLSNFFCQESLTKSDTWVENNDNYLSLLKMGKLDKSALAGALMLGGAMVGEPALAEDQRPSVQLASSTISQVENCGVFVREQRELAAQNGTPMSRADTVSLLADCRGGKLEARIAEQQRIIAALRSEIAAINLEVNENGQIIDANGQAIAQIVSINNQLILRRQNAEARMTASLDRIEQFLLNQS
jgi:hypothetical protein